MANHFKYNIIIKHNKSLKENPSRKRTEKKSRWLISSEFWIEVIQSPIGNGEWLWEASITASKVSLVASSSEANQSVRNIKAVKTNR